MNQTLRRWKRNTILALLLLAGGAIVNIVVAWGLSYGPGQDNWTNERKSSAPRKWPKYLEAQDWPAPRELVERLGMHTGIRVYEIRGGDPKASYERAGPHTELTYVVMEVREFGLPLQALRWETHGVRAGPRGLDIVRRASDAAGYRKGIDISEPTGALKQGYLRCLPLVPIWPGFIINTLFYALLIWLLFFAPFAARRMLRRRRGRCERCAYPIGVSAVCTECGAAVSPCVTEPADESKDRR